MRRSYQKKNLHIDIVDGVNEINTGLLDNALDVNTSGDMDIIDSQEIPCSQMPHTDPYQTMFTTAKSLIFLYQAKQVKIL